MKNKINVVDTIIEYVNANFLDGDYVNQVKNFKNLNTFINKNRLMSPLNSNEYEKLLNNEKITKMISTLLSLKDYTIFLQNQLFYSLSLIYSNNNGIKLDLDSKQENDDINFDDNLDSPIVSDIVKSYLRSLKYEPFTAEEEREIFRRYSSGETDLKDKIIKHNLRLVVSVAKRYANSNVEFMDLIQEGNIGLITAIDKFNCETGNRFSTYAIWWIRQALTHYIVDNYRIIRIPTKVYDVLNKVNKYIKKYELTHEGRIPTSEEISESLNIDIRKVEIVLGLNTIASLNTPVDADDNYDTELGDLIEDTENADFDNDIYYEEFRNMIFNSDILNEREKDVIMYRYGFLDGIIYNLENVGKILKVTFARVSQIESKALRKLRNNNSISQFNI